METWKDWSDTEILSRLSLTRWREGTRRTLAQLAVGFAQAESIMEDITPKGGMPVDQYQAARAALRARRRLQVGLRHIQPSSTPPVAAAVLVEQAARRVVDGPEEYIFEHLTDLNLALIANGHGEFFLPRNPDLEFWDAQDSPSSFTEYILGLEQLTTQGVLP